MKKAIVIGSGPSGISAALYLQRSGNVAVTVIARDAGALAKAEKIENFYGIAEPVTGEELHRRGIEGAKRLGVKLIKEQVVSLTFDEHFKPMVKTDKKVYTADVILLAMGAARKSIYIKGLKEFEGKGVSYCAVCDAFFYRNKDVAVLGDGEYALHEALTLADTCQSVTILSNGAKPRVDIPEYINVVTKKVISIDGEKNVQFLTFEDKERLHVSGVFVALGVAGSIDLARKIGVQVSNSCIVVNENMQTNIPCIFAAGDCIGGILQVSKAVADGTRAGLAMINFLKKQF